MDLAWACKVPGANCELAAQLSSPLGSDTVPYGCLVCSSHIVEHLPHVQEGTGSLLGSARAGWSGELVCLSGLVGSEDVRGMLQVVLG